VRCHLQALNYCAAGAECQVAKVRRGARVRCEWCSGREGKVVVDLQREGTNVFTSLLVVFVSHVWFMES
jgi:hypothetical protein